MEFSLFDQLTKKESFTDSEIKQASFLRKAIKNNMADQIKEQKEKELESDYEDRKRSLIYV